MYVIDVTETKPTVAWRTYSPGVRLELKALNKKQMRILTQEAVRLSTEAGVLQENGNPDPDILDRLIWCFIVVSWEGFVDPAGSATPRTDDLVVAVFTKFSSMATLAVYQAGTLAETESKLKADKLKNSQSSQDGTKGDQKA